VFDLRRQKLEAVYYRLQFLLLCGTLSKSSIHFVNHSLESLRLTPLLDRSHDCCCNHNCEERGEDEYDDVECPDHVGSPFDCFFLLEALFLMRVQRRTIRRKSSPSLLRCLFVELPVLESYLVLDR
jgi:hypothetical protein